jgi:hypothetical protein
VHFNASETRLYTFEARLYTSEARLYTFEARLYSIEARLYSIEARLYSIEARLYSIEARIDAIEACIDFIEPTQHAMFESANLGANDRYFRTHDRMYDGAKLGALSLEAKRHRLLQALKAGKNLVVRHRAIVRHGDCRFVNGRWRPCD